MKIPVYNVESTPVKKPPDPVLAISVLVGIPEGMQHPAGLVIQVQKGFE